jgi:hypothetical protein
MPDDHGTDLNTSKGKHMRRFAVVAILTFSALPVAAQNWVKNQGAKTNQSSFRAIEEWPDPNDVRNAAGAPGSKYWQQQVDYVIRATLDTTRHAVTGSERITYRNNSPARLSYIWLQLDQNIDDPQSRANLIAGALPPNIPAQARASPGSRTVRWRPQDRPCPGRGRQRCKGERALHPQRHRHEGASGPAARDRSGGGHRDRLVVQRS